MIETLSRHRAFDSMEFYSKENVPPAHMQGDFLRHALLEGAELERPDRLLKGPHYNAFTAIMRDVDRDIKAIDPDFTPEHIMSSLYQNRDVRMQVNTLNGDGRRELQQVSAKRFNRISEITESTLLLERDDQKLAMGLLNDPPYHWQGEDWRNYESMRGCTNACFRMIFDSIAGWTPSEEMVASELIAQYETPVVDDVTYSNIFQTEVFKESCNREIISLEVIGADLAFIETLTSRMKRKLPQVEVYCMVNLSSKTAGKDIWHSCVLLGADNEKITYHDPSSRRGGAYSSDPYEQFVERWAITYNRARLIIAA